MANARQCDLCGEFFLCGATCLGAIHFDWLPNSNNPTAKRKTVTVDICSECNLKLGLTPLFALPHERQEALIKLLKRCKREFNEEM